MTATKDGLLVTHDPLDAMVLADQLVIIENGHVVQEGTQTEIARRPRTNYVAQLVGLNLYRRIADGTTVALDTLWATLEATEIQTYLG